MCDLLHGAILAGVDVEPANRRQDTYLIKSEREDEKGVPVGLVVHGRHIAFLYHTVLLGQVGFGECLS